MAIHERDTSPPVHSEETTRCPYCREETAVQLPLNFEPIYVHCVACGRQFIVERITGGIDVFRIENAPCNSDPDCREIEIGQGQED